MKYEYLEDILERIASAGMREEADTIHTYVKTLQMKSDGVAALQRTLARRGESTAGGNVWVLAGRKTRTSAWESLDSTGVKEGETDNDAIEFLKGMRAAFPHYAEHEIISEAEFEKRSQPTQPHVSKKQDVKPADGLPVVVIKKEDITLKGVRTFAGHDGEGFNCTLFVHGKKVADVVNLANGGEFEYHWHTGHNRDGGDVMKGLTALAAAQPPFESEGSEPLAWNLDMLVESMVSDYLDERRLRRDCKSKTLFRLVGDKPDAMWQWKVPYSPDVAEKIRAKHGTKLIEIVNERFLGKPSVTTTEPEDEEPSLKP